MKIDKVNLHKEIVLDLNKLYKDKNSDYGDSFKRVRDKYPNAILIRLEDKLSRLETLLGGQTQKVKDESIRDTLVDLANYSILEIIEMDIERHKNDYL